MTDHEATSGNLSEADYKHFVNWLNLEVSETLWKDKFKVEIDDFFQNVFFELDKPADFSVRIHKIKHSLEVEPLKAWFDWLENKFILYCFIFKRLKIKEVLETFAIEDSRFIDIFKKHLDEVGIASKLDSFIEGDFLTKNIQDINYFIEKSENQVDVEEIFRECPQSEVFKSLEFILYPEWESKVKSFKKKQDFSRNEKVYIENTFRLKKIFFDSLLILISLALAFALFRTANNYYNKHLSGKIDIYEPDFFWLDRNLTFKDTKIVERNINLTEDEIEKLENEEKEDIPFIQEEREGVESEVMVMTAGELPQSLYVTENDSSVYEEGEKGGYFRDRIYGRNKAYRIIMNNVDPEEIKSKVNKLMTEIDAKPFGRVKPGQKIPGGVYFNLLVSDQKLNNFLDSLQTLDEQSRLYVSKTNQPSPEGQSKVFIWIKSI
ncbi:MAG: hypothetical protein H6621_05600 [Halobacteriovoraceae bacterium]|nr:hypothetical protein [Halobacteriovoraceae bacterium]